VSAEARLAATVVVLRPASSGAPEILMVRRARKASFMADAFVFPGGRVDEADGGDLRAAAVRELREEADVTVEPASLRPLSRWITPSAEPKRFDTHFFLAAVAAGTEARVDAAEVTELIWADAAELLRRHEAGLIKLPPPTLRTLDELAAYASIEAIFAWAAQRPILPIQPKLVVGAHLEIVLPWHPSYATSEGEGDPIDPTSDLAFGTGRYLLRDGRFWPA
jgi:8-oxo-dGTP pyrophosphatase MutT (NUDIX family)